MLQMLYPLQIFTNINNEELYTTIQSNFKICNKNFYIS